MRTLIKIFIAITLALSVITTSYAAGFGTHWWLSRDDPTAEATEPFAVFWEAWSREKLPTLSSHPVKFLRIKPE